MDQKNKGYCKDLIKAVCPGVLSLLIYIYIRIF